MTVLQTTDHTLPPRRTYLVSIDDVVLTVRGLLSSSAQLGKIRAARGLRCTQAELKLSREDAWQPRILLRFGSVRKDWRRSDSRRSCQPRKRALSDASQLILDDDEVEDVVV